MTITSHQLLVTHGTEAIARGAWAEARASFEAALTHRETAETYEGLSWTVWWLNDGDADTLDALLAAAGFRDVMVEVVTRPARFPSPDQFERLTTIAAAAVLPEFAAMAEPARESLIAAVRDDLGDTLAEYRQGTDLVFLLTANIAVARA
ncbi:MAG: hypothetical protein M3464_09945 [Chloroflexota bacterium]|nr:hypothetical protein [Chloroflexota bacterium]